MRFTLALSLAVLATGISGLALPDILSNYGLGKRHEHGHEHEGFKRFKPVTDGEDTIVVKNRRSAAIDFPDGGDSDGGVDNIHPPPPAKIERSATIDFPDGGDSDGGVDNIKPRPVKNFKRIPLEREDADVDYGDYADDADFDGVEDADYGDVEVKKLKRNPVDLDG